MIVVRWFYDVYQFLPIYAKNISKTSKKAHSFERALTRLNET